MPSTNCPKCEKVIELDGFAGGDKMFYCECGTIVAQTEIPFEIQVVPRHEVSLSGLPFIPVPSNCALSQGIFILISRWNKNS